MKGGKSKKQNLKKELIQELQQEENQEDNQDDLKEEVNEQEIDQQENQEEIESEQDINDENLDEDDLQKEIDEQNREEEELEEGDDQYLSDENLEGACDDDQNPKLLTDKQQVEAGLLSKMKGADQALINMKIHEITKILCNLKSEREEGRSRQSYLEELNEYLCQYYSYNKELMELFQQMFNPNELLQFLEANEQQRVLTIRTNTLKTRRKELAQVLIQRGVNLDPLAEWSKVGIKIYDSKVPVGATPEYLAGHYMLQSASSFLPVIALAPQVNEKILDMAAAPGGKTSYIAQLMKNTGQLFANDVSAARLKGLFYNLQRMGISNTVVCNYDGRKFTKVMQNFDRVLLDAPCTGLGIISRDPSIKGNKTMIDIYKHAHLQREMILSAIDCCKKDGYIVYSTCSISPQENEAVVNYALAHRYVKIVECGIDIGEEGLTKFLDKRYHPDLKKSRRIYPHIHNLDGFYVCKLKKLQNGDRIQTDNEKENKEQTLQQKLEEIETLTLNELRALKRPKRSRSKQMKKTDQIYWDAVMKRQDMLKQNEQLQRKLKQSKSRAKFSKFNQKQQKRMTQQNPTQDTQVQKQQQIKKHNQKPEQINKKRTSGQSQNDVQNKVQKKNKQ
ncbi:hypothetical protein PPERSA_08682 [Pseudocohnilembus persalinus]|uniref:SAM-dependent MTase RsmB/NOP-type domain-containing protein n=1 Tax=Pseudocohnilembus persalinus TaxID=266149 RepID=A0A0V0R875_PSEPJ|nr:hypothetical protein PPERSA_08682 [Pseudocohnilembus persalinus]|eukprot:KRX10687.1 hypothetical protein PPERSA_08682 [Pseudocohnilembus persalinus]